MQRERDAEHRRERNQARRRMRQPARLRLRIAIAHVVALTRDDGATDHPAQPGETKRRHEHRDDEADLPRGIGRRAQVLHRDPVLDFRRARGSHREGDRAEADGAGDEPPWQAGLAEQREGERKHREGDDEQAHAAIREHGAGADDGDQRMTGTEPLHDPLRDAVGRAAVFHHLAEDRAEQEDEEPRGDEAAEPRHVGGGEVVRAFARELRKQRQPEREREQQRAERAPRATGRRRASSGRSAAQDCPAVRSIRSSWGTWLR